jgi:protein-L-isoaspartate(D-aspartate) O-methyltransferase
MNVPSAPGTAASSAHTADDLVRAARRVGVDDERVLEAIASIPRAAFVAPAHVDDAYLDLPLPIPHGQVTTQRP